MSFAWSALRVSIIGASMLQAATSAACPGQTQMEMNDCASEDYRRIDAQLAAVYARFDKTPELKTAERAWIAYRDAECAYEAAGVKGGSMAPMVYSMCMTNLTKARIDVLKANEAEGQ